MMSAAGLDPALHHDRASFETRPNALLRMRYVFEDIREIPHPEEAAEQLSRRTHRAVGMNSDRFTSSGRDKTIDLAVAEQPLPVLFDQLVFVGAARADFWAFRTVLHHGPVGAHARAHAVEGDRDIGNQMDRPRPRVTRTFAQ